MKEFVDKLLAKPVAVGIIIGAVTTSVVKIMKTINQSKKAA